MVADPLSQQKDHARASASASATSASVKLWLSSVFLSSSRAIYSPRNSPVANLRIASAGGSCCVSNIHVKEGSPKTYVVIKTPQNHVKHLASLSEPVFSHAAAAARAPIDAGPSPSMVSLGATRKRRRTELKMRFMSFAVFVIKSAAVQLNGARIRAASNTTLARFASVAGSTPRDTERSATAQSPSVSSTYLISVSHV